MSPRERMGKVRAYVAPPDGYPAAGPGEGGCEGERQGQVGSMGWGGRIGRMGRQAAAQVRSGRLLLGQRSAWRGSYLNNFYVNHRTQETKGGNRRESKSDHLRYRFPFQFILFTTKKVFFYGEGDSLRYFRNSNIHLFLTERKREGERERSRGRIL